MKRVKAGCILQTLVFLQKEDCGLNAEEQLAQNRAEVELYQRNLTKNRTRHQILEIKEQPDSSIIVRVRKHLNDKTPVDGYFD